MKTNLLYVAAVGLLFTTLTFAFVAMTSTNETVPVNQASSVDSQEMLRAE